MSRQPRPQGFTLIEILLVLSLLASVLSGTVGLLSLVQKSNQQGQENLMQRREIRRFANDLRRDMRSAGEAEIKEDQLVLKNQSPPLEIIYQVDKGELTRSQAGGDDKAIKSYDQYRLGDQARSAIEWVEPGSRVQWLITLPALSETPIVILATRRPS